jgi:uncharacterized protein
LKTITTLCIFLVFYSLRGQDTSFHVSNYLKEGCSVFPFQEKLTIDNYESIKSKPKFIQKRNTIELNPDWDSVKNNNINFTFSSLYTLRKLFRSDMLPHFDENIPPSIDSLKDGLYVQYFEPLIYIDGDTLKFEENRVAKLFSVRDNLIQGEAIWFTPLEQMKYKWGTFSQGQREGEWKFDVSFLSSLKGKRRLYWKEYSVICFYSKGIKNGLEIKNCNSYIEKINFDSGKKSGFYSYTYNDTLILTSGYFKDDIKIGEWYFYDLKWKYKRNRYKEYEYNLVEHYIINDSKILSIETPINRSVKQRNGRVNIYNLHNNKNYFDPIVHSSSIPDNNLDIFTNDSNGGKYYYYYLEYEKYYPNGQLFTKFKLEDGQFPKVNDTIFRENGKPLNILIYDSLENKYEQQFFDADGKINDLRFYMPTGEQINQKTINGIDYSNYENFKKWVFQKDLPLELTDSDSNYLVKKTLLNNDLEVINQMKYNPKLRKGELYNVYTDAIIQKGYFQFDTNFQTVHYSNYYNFDQLKFSFQKTDSLTLNKISHNPLISNYISTLSDNRDLDGLTICSLNDLPFTGNLIFKFASKKDTIIYNKNEIIVHRKNLEYDILKTLFPFLEDYLFHEEFIANELFFQYPYDDEASKKELKTLKRLYINSYTFPFINGKISGTIQAVNNKKGLLAEMSMQDNKAHGVVKLMNYYLCPISYSDWIYSLNSFSNKYMNTLITFENGERKGLELGMESKKEIGLKQINPIPLKNGLFIDSSYNKIVKQYYKNDLLDGLSEVYDKTNKLITSKHYEQDTLNGEAKVYLNESIYQSGKYLNGKFTDTLYTYNKDQSIQSKLIFSEQNFYKQEIYQAHYLRSVFISSMNAASYPTDDYSNALNHSQSNTWFRKPGGYGRTYNPFIESGLYTEYNSEGKIIKSGNLTQGERIGLWKFDLPYQGKYTILYQDSVLKLNDSLSLKTKGIYTNFDSASRVLSVRYILSTESLYNCGQNETYDLLTFYIIKDSLQTWSDTNFQYYYPNGVLQSEGKNDKGLPEGLWKFYNDNGTLREMGHFKNGLKTGRWLAGDLSKIHYTGDLCLDLDDPEAQSYLSQLKTELEIEEAYFEKGELIRKDVFQVRGK